MNKQTKIACLTWAFVAIISSCKKNEISKSALDLPGKSIVNSVGDTKWDVLGYGYDATGNLIEKDNSSDAPIIDMQRFVTDYSQRIDVNTGTEGTDDFYAGATVLDYLKDLNKHKSIGVDFTAGNKDTSKSYFSASVAFNKGNQNTTTIYSRYSYATYESLLKIKRIRFTGDVSIDLLMNYLTPEFLSNAVNLTADQLVARYGTHVLMDISLGGRYRFDYSAAIVKQSDYVKKTRGAKAGLLGKMTSLIGVTINTDVTTEEINNAKTENLSITSRLNFRGGTNGGQNISFDANGSPTQSFNIASWQQSVNTSNSVLIKVDRAVPLYSFISDPVKRDEVSAAIDRYINNSQRDELGEAPVFEFLNASTGSHTFTINVNDYPYAQNGWTNAGAKFYEFTTQRPGTVPVHHFISTSQNNHVYTINRNDYAYEQNGYTYGGIAYYAYPNQVSGTIPVYVLYHSGNHKHVYTANLDGYPYAQNGWSNLGVAFYGFKVDTSF